MLKKIDDRLFLIGVAHVLPSSAREVEEVIERERPDVVAVELDPVRYITLTRGKGPKFRDLIQGGPNLLLMSALLQLIQGKFSRQTGMPAGDDMLAAIKKANEVGAHVKFIDRYIGITMQRLIHGMPLREKLRLFLQMLLTLLPFGKEVDLKRLTEEEMVAHLLNELRSLSPRAYSVLIEERDSYMSSRLAELLLSGKRVVCVVGAGHVPGIYRRLSGWISSGWSLNLKYKTC